MLPMLPSRNINQQKLLAALRKVFASGPLKPVCPYTTNRTPDIIDEYLERQRAKEQAKTDLSHAEFLAP